MGPLTVLFHSAIPRPSAKSKCLQRGENLHLTVDDVVLMFNELVCALRG